MKIQRNETLYRDYRGGKEMIVCKGELRLKEDIGSFVQKQTEQSATSDDARFTGKRRSTHVIDGSYLEKMLRLSTISDDSDVREVSLEHSGHKKQ